MIAQKNPAEKQRRNYYQKTDLLNTCLQLLKQVLKLDKPVARNS